MDYPTTPALADRYTALVKTQWDLIHNPQSTTGLFDDMEEGASKGKSQFRFLVNGKDYSCGSTYVTLYTGKKLEIKIQSSDTTYRFDKIKWLLEGKEIKAKDGNPATVDIDITPAALSRKNNIIEVRDSLNKKISALKIKVYNAPYVEFSKSSRYKGEYLFDMGYEFERLASPDYYDTIHVGKSNMIYYAPVLGLDKGQSAELRVNVKDFPSFAEEDENFQVVIKASKNGFVIINGSPDSLVLNAMQLSSLKHVTIEAKDYLNTTNLHIYAYLPSIGKKIGLIEYYCREKIIRNVHLIYVKFKDETRYPDYLDYNKLQAYLNTYAMNQLFLNIIVDTVNVNLSLTKKRLYEKVDSIMKVNKSGDFNQKIYIILIREIYNQKRLVETSPTDDIYLITNLERGDTGGFHGVGVRGGLQLKCNRSAIGETPEELTAHELGHWLGLPHTFRVNSVTGKVQDFPKGFTWITEKEGETWDNFMDYNVRRKTWFRFQLLHVINNINKDGINKN